MRPGRLLIMLLLALAASGCIQTAMQSTAVAPQADLDTLMYEGRKGPPQIAVAPEPATTASVPTATAYAADEPAYTLDSGDKLRVVVFGQDGLTNSYTVAAGGQITMPLIGAVAA